MMPQMQGVNKAGQRENPEKSLIEESNTISMEQSNSQSDKQTRAEVDVKNNYKER